MSKKLDIVMYHYVRDFARTRYPGIKGLDKAGFVRQLDHLQSKYEIVRMEDVIASVRGQGDLPENAALLTFDDGYAEHYDIVFPELFDRGLQGSFFPPVEPIKDLKLLDVNRVHFILASGTAPEVIAAELDGLIDAARGQYDLLSIAAYRAEWAHPNRFDDGETIYIKRMLQTVLPETLRNAISSQLFAKYISIDEAAFSAELYMSREQARVMQASGMYFGSHGNSHYWLNRIPRETQENEIDVSLDFLRDIGSPVDDFWVMCYPFGGWDDSLLDVIRQRGGALGLTTRVDTADLEKDDPLTLPRFDTNDFPQ